MKTRIIFLTLLIASPVLATDYYVRANGTASSGNPPTAPGPCSTQANTLSVANHNSSNLDYGDNVIICDDGGAYSSRLIVQTIGTASGAGSAENKLTYMAESNDTVVFNTTGGGFTSLQDYVTLDCNGSDGTGSITFNDTASADFQRSINFNAADYATITGCTVVGTFGAYTDTKGITVGQGNNYSISYNEVSHFNVGIANDSSGNTDGVPWVGYIGYNYVHDMDAPPTGASDGILVKASHGQESSSDKSGVTIEYNRITNWCDDAIDFIEAQGGLIQYNEIGPNTESCSGGNCNVMKLGGCGPGGDTWTGSQIVRYNYVHDVQYTSCDVTGITSNGSMGQEIYGNVIDTQAGDCISLDGDDADASSLVWKVYNNTVGGCGDDGVEVYRANSGGTHLIQNNIVDTSTDDGIAIESDVTDSVTGGYNILYVSGSSVKNPSTCGGGSDPCYTDTGTTDSTGDPLLTNFIPGAQSLAIDNGVYLSGYDTVLRADTVFTSGSYTPQTQSNAGADGKPDIGIPFPKFGGD